ncbi:MAG: hypothetical protein R2706_18175 [Acidimicrobiales bacterium]
MPTTDPSEPDDEGTPDDRLPLAAAADPSVRLFEGLRVPQPIPAAPPLRARVLGFAGVLLGGVLGGLIGYGVGELLSGGNNLIAAVGFVVGAAGCAVGVGIIVSLTLRAMNEWNAVQHPDEAT